MKKIILYIVTLTMAVGCTETMIDEPMIEATSSVETVSATFNLSIEGATSDTRVSVVPGAEEGDAWKVDWEDGDIVCVYSIEQNASTTLTYVAEGNTGGTFSGEVYPGENRIYYRAGYSYLSTNTTLSDTGEALIPLYSAFGLPEDAVKPMMISSEVINVEVTDDDGDGIVTDTFDVTMQQVGAAIDFKMTFTGIPDDLDLELYIVNIGGAPDGATDGEYVEVPDYIYTYANKSVDASDFIHTTVYSDTIGGEMSTAIENDTEYSLQFSVMPFIFEADKKLQVRLHFNEGLITKSFDFTNNSGANFDLPRATYTTLSKSYDLSGISDDVDAIFAGTWAADAVAFADTTSAGTESDPIEIASEEELAYLAKISTGMFSVKCAEGTYYKLTKDLDLGGKEWYPIGGTNIYFDGDNHTISNLTIGEGDYQGLFGSVFGAVISNLNMEDPVVSGGGYVGAICGSMDCGEDYYNPGLISNCSVEGGSVTGSGNYVGAVCGYMYYESLISGCSVKDCTVTSSGNYTGGVVGYMNNGDIIDSSVEGGSVTGGTNTGGVVGYLLYSNMIRCYNEGAPVSGALYTGGVVGRAWGSTSVTSSISECYNTGVCSLADMNSTSSIIGVGGVVGSAGNYTTVTRCYNTGDINGVYAFGGVVGQLASQGVVVACYNTGVISEASNSISIGAGSGNGGIAGLASVATSTLSACYDVSQSQYMVGYASPTSVPCISSCYCLSPTVLTNPGYGIGASFESASVNCAQLSDVAALNAKVADMNAAANTALGTTDVSYFTLDDTNTYLPSLIGEQIKYGTTSSDQSSSIEDIGNNGTMVDNN